jgi:hypothetical protein
MLLTADSRIASDGDGKSNQTIPERLLLPVVDLSGDNSRHVVVEAGSETAYQGHPTTLLLSDNRTIYCVWTHGHGGPCGPLKRSPDGGLTWSSQIAVPENWRLVRNCPSLYRLPQPAGGWRIFVYAGQGPDGCMHESHSTDDGQTWSPMRSLGLNCVMPFCSIIPVDGGRSLLGLTNIRRPGHAQPDSNVIAASRSFDGGLTWEPWRIIADDPRYKFCEPWIVKSPDGGEWSCLLRENNRGCSWRIVTCDEGKSWSAPVRLPGELSGDRHISRYAPDGRLVVAFRDRNPHSGTTGHFVAWVGSYDDLCSGRGQYRIKLLHSHAGADCGYPGLEVLPDGTFVATTYVKYRPGNELHSIVSTRFNLCETDRLATLCS